LAKVRTQGDDLWQMVLKHGHTKPVPAIRKSQFSFLEENQERALRQRFKHVALRANPCPDIEKSLAFIAWFDAA
jgi:hypothetical protein